MSAPHARQHIAVVHMQQRAYKHNTHTHSLAQYSHALARTHNKTTHSHKHTNTTLTHNTLTHSHARITQSHTFTHTTLIHSHTCTTQSHTLTCAELHTSPEKKNNKKNQKNEKRVKPTHTRRASATKRVSPRVTRPDWSGGSLRAPAAAMPVIELKWPQVSRNRYGSANMRPVL